MRKGEAVPVAFGADWLLEGEGSAQGDGGFAAIMTDKD
jgi:hypothetical protein